MSPLIDVDRSNCSYDLQPRTRSLPSGWESEVTTYSLISIQIPFPCTVVVPADDPPSPLPNVQAELDEKPNLRSVPFMGDVAAHVRKLSDFTRQRSLGDFKPDSRNEMSCALLVDLVAAKLQLSSLEPSPNGMLSVI
jgi:hypothetical protein